MHEPWADNMSPGKSQCGRMTTSLLSQINGSAGKLVEFLAVQWTLVLPVIQRLQVAAHVELGAGADR